MIISAYAKPPNSEAKLGDLSLEHNIFYCDVENSVFSPLERTLTVRQGLIVPDGWEISQKTVKTYCIQILEFNCFNTLFSKAGFKIKV